MPLVIGQDTNPNRTASRLRRVVMRRRPGNSLLTNKHVRSLTTGSVNSSSRRTGHFLLPFFWGRGPRLATPCFLRSRSH